MASPTLVVEIAFDSDPLDDTPTWTDVTTHVREVDGVTIDRGRSTELDTFSPGRCSLVLNNRTRLFDPSYAAGTYYGKLLPGKQIRIRGTHTSATHTIFHGHIEEWPTTFGMGKRDVTSEITAFDSLTMLNAMTQPDPLFEYTLSTVGSCALWLRTCDENTWFDHSGYGRHFYRQAEATPSDQSPVQVGGPLAPGLTGDSVRGGRWSPGTWAATAAWSASWWFSTSIKMDAPPIDGVNIGDADYVVTYENVMLAGLDGTDPDQMKGYVGLAYAESSSASSEGVQLRGITATTVNDGEVHHAAVVVTGSTSATVYLDGVSVGSGAVSAMTQWGLIDLGDRYYDVPAIGGVTIEGVVAPGRASTAVEDVAIFSKALTAGEVLGLYQRGAGRLDETTTARATRLLDSVDWPAAWRSLTASPAGIVSDYLPAGQGTVAALDLVAETEQGRVFVDRSGLLTLQGRYHNSTATRGNTSQLTITDVPGGGVPYSDLSLTRSRREVRNAVTVNASRATLGDDEDATSITTYGRQSSTISTLLRPFPESPDAEVMADALVAIYKDAVDRFTQPITLVPERTPTLWPTVLQTEIGDRITHTITPTVGPAVTRYLSIERITWSIRKRLWQVQIDVAPIPYATAAGAGFLVLDSATYGVLGTNLLGY
jgi:hypothetical protein